MPKVEIYNLRPLGWESDPEDEFFKLSTLDYCVGQVFTNFALFFKLPDGTDKDEIVSVLKRGLEVTLSQCRQLCGILENAPNGDGLCFHKKRESTVEFHVQHLEKEEEGDKYPTFDDLEAQHFVSRSLGNLDTWCVPPMTYGEKPEAHPSANPKASAFKATFIRGGLVFMMHHHHYANDVMGWAGELNQLADNCAAIFRDPSNPSLPDWDPACLDLSRVTAPTPPPEAEMVDGPVSPLRHPDHRPAEWLLFHLPKSKAAELKKALAGFPPPPPTDDGPGGGGGQPGWISTYDAFTALICRTLTKHRLKIFSGTDTSSSPFLFGEAIDMRRRFLHQPPNNIQVSSGGDGDGGHPQVQAQSQGQGQGQTQVQTTTTAVPQRMQGNVLFVALSSSPRSPPSTNQPLMTIEQVADSAPLSALARYVRGLTDSVTEEGLSAALSEIAKVRDKTSLFLRTDSFPPLSCFVTDWRDARPCEADFGFARPRAMRFPFGTVTAGLVVVYPPQGRRARSVRGSPGGEEDENDDDDEGSEFSIAVEKEIKEELLGDEEWKRWFEFRGVDGVEGVLR